MKQICNEWKPVHLEGAILAGSLDGLIGIEELTNYDQDSVQNRKNQLRVNKRNSSEISTNESSDGVPKKKKVKILSKRQSGEYVRNPDLVSRLTFTKAIKEEGNELTDINSISSTGNLVINKPKMKKKSKIDKSKNKMKVEIGAKENDDKENDYNVDEMKSWSIVPLPEEILQALAKLKFTKPTPIQELTLPPAILGRRDILGAAETGSGKTLAFALPILSGILKLKEKEKNSLIATDQQLHDSKYESDGEEFGDNISVEIFKKAKRPLYALVLTPTRELAVQIKNHLLAVTKFTDIKVAVVLGGMAAVKQERLLAKGPEIVVATPGRLWELIQEGNPHLSQVDDISFLAIDETDRMLERGHYRELQQLLERINMDEHKRKQRQNFVFSATLTLVHDLPSHLIQKKRINKKYRKKINKQTPQQKLQHIIDTLGITDPKVIDVTKLTGTASSLTECRISCAMEEKDYYVYYFLRKHLGRTLIFCNSIGCVKRLATLLGLLGCSALPLHASMQQRQRLKNLERFRDDEHGVLVATDVAARGLDIPLVQHVLHYQTPRTSESYVHRSGRTARACQDGITVLFIDPSEIPAYQQLCNTLGRTQDLPIFPVFENLLKAVKQRVNLARDLDRLELKIKRVNSENGWLQKVAENMDIVIDGYDGSDNEARDESLKIKREATLKRKQLTSLLSKPLFPQGFSFKYPTLTGEINIPLVQGQQHLLNAVDLMKTEIEKKANKKSKMRKLFKPKLTIAEKKTERKAEKKKLKNDKRKLKKLKKNDQ